MAPCRASCIRCSRRIPFDRVPRRKSRLSALCCSTRSRLSALRCSTRKGLPVSGLVWDCLQLRPRGWRRAAGSQLRHLKRRECACCVPCTAALDATGRWMCTGAAAVLTGRRETSRRSAPPACRWAQLSRHRQHGTADSAVVCRWAVRQSCADVERRVCCRSARETRAAVPRALARTIASVYGVAAQVSLRELSGDVRETRSPCHGADQHAETALRWR